MEIVDVVREEEGRLEVQGAFMSSCVQYSQLVVWNDAGAPLVFVTPLQALRSSIGDSRGEPGARFNRTLGSALPLVPCNGTCSAW